MRNASYFIAIIFFSVCCTSCSISKRYHNSGFQIEFGRKYGLEKENKGIKKAQFKIPIETALPPIIINSSSSDSLSLIESTFIKNQEVRIVKDNLTIPTHYEGIVTFNKKKTYLKYQKQNPDNNDRVLMIISLVFGVLSLLFYLVGYSMASSAGAGCVDLVAAMFFYGLAIGAGVTAILFFATGLAMKALKENKKQSPKKEA